MTQLPHADLIFLNGSIHTMDDIRSRPSALAVTAGRISALGPAAQEACGSGTEVIDLDGRALLPGFVDAHVHPAVAGLESQYVRLGEATTVAECLCLIADYGRDRPHHEWIVGSGWSMELFDGGAPTRDLLDSVINDRPVYLSNLDHHGAWVNSHALRLANVNADTPDPCDGRIERDVNGFPTGMLQEGAMRLVSRHIPEPTLAQKLSGLLAAQRLLHSYGIIGWQDALLGDSPLMADVTDSYLAAVSTGCLTAKVGGALWWDRTRGLDQLDELIRRRDRHRELGFTTNTVKIMQDGIAENFTAAMLEPYFDCCGKRTTNRGLSFVDPGKLPSYVTALDRVGFQVHFHALGDRAVREALDAVEAAHRSNGRSDNRHHLAHLQVVHADDISRFARCGAAATIQPLWATHEPQMDTLTIPFLGADRAARQYPFADLVRSGAIVAGGSDWPVSSPNPWEAIHVAVNRRTAASAHPMFQPEQRLEIDAALCAYTRAAAYVNHLDDTGTLRLGYAADLVVVDQDPYTTRADRLAGITVDMTYVDGRKVFER
jgi:predicted amidohydrolase YtcJ